MPSIGFHLLKGECEIGNRSGAVVRDFTKYYKQKNPKVIGLQLPLATPSGRLNPLCRGYRSPPGKFQVVPRTARPRAACLESSTGVFWGERSSSRPLEDSRRAALHAAYGF